MTKHELFERISTILHDTFEIDHRKITPDAQLHGDLDIDSIDAVDLIVQLKPLLGARLQPDAFKSVRTVQDVVDVLHGLIREAA
ncbi:acyl carrier protein [Lysobacter niastensis]|uniref:Acyl carrier protein n=1 Tax=Lysobacter niastensis TaxID=380629 RepID=A0ABS0B472_9GAMM|nr:acyl carrier protein [Lysobacter niastensis]MBF6023366.1 acyl carrier protein [Lysobacter niastensis]